MKNLELLKEIEAWLCFNTEPSKEETAKLRKSINDHICEQLNLPPVMESVCSCSKGKGIDHDENGKAYCIDCGKFIEQTEP